MVRKKIRSRPHKSRRGGGSKITNQVSIDNRPQHIELRNEIGHWEGDFVIGKNDKSAIGTIIESKTRFILIIKLESKKADEVANEFPKRLNQVKYYLKKMTYDNAIEMARHEIITKKTGMKFTLHTHMLLGKEELMKTQMDLLEGIYQRELILMKLT